MTLSASLIVSFQLFSAPLAEPVYTSPPTPNKTALFAGAMMPAPNANFEDTSIATFVHRPAWAGWTFIGNSGIVKEGQAYADGHPNLPAGEYAAFIQREGYFESSITLTPGVYRLVFWASQRIQNGTANAQSIAVEVDGLRVFQKQLESDLTGQTLSTAPFRVTSGPALVRFSGLSTGTDSALVDLVRVEPMADWQSASSWSPSGIPTSGQNVRIPPQVPTALDGACAAATLQIEGSLDVMPAATSSLQTRWALVHGGYAAFTAGTETLPISGEFTLQLTGDLGNTENILGFGSKFLGARDGGIIDFHGAPQTSWTRLAATAPAGQNFLIVEGSQLQWGVGDQIVIAPTSAVGSANDGAWNEAETRMISSLSAEPNNRTRVVFAAPLAHRHLGVTETYSRTKNGETTTWTVPLSAEVGLLTRNVRITSALSPGSSYGGHVAIMGVHCPACTAPGVGRFSHVEFDHLGQKQRVGRYPIHWHMLAEEGLGQFVRDSSIHRSFNRAVTIHGTNSVDVSRNVAFDHVGHGIFLEDGSERFNRFESNLVLNTRRPIVGEEIIPTDNSHDQFQNRSPSSFWITNPNNEFIGNVVAGTAGSAYWFAFPTSPTGHSATDPRFAGLKPFEEPLGSFRNNVAHSCRLALDIFDRVDVNTLELIKNLSWNITSVQTLERFTAWGNDIALYSGLGDSRDNVEFVDCMLVDNREATVFAAYLELRNSLLVADSGNAIWPAATARYAIALYDGPARFRDCHLVGFGAAPANLARTAGGAVPSMNWILSGTTYDLFPRFAFNNYQGAGSATEARIWAKILIDEDGSLTGHPLASMVTNHPMLTTGNEFPAPPSWQNVVVSNQEFARLYWEYYNAATRLSPPVATIRRERFSSPGSPLVFTNQTQFPGHLFPVIVNDADFFYTIAHANPAPGNRIHLVFGDTALGDETVLRFNDLASLPSCTVSDATEKSSLTALRTSPTSGFYKAPAGHLWIKIVSLATMSNERTTLNITW